MALRSRFGAVAICGLAAGMAPATDYPLSIGNCGQTLVFDDAPERVVTIGQSTTKMLYALGLGEQAQGTSVWFNDVPPEFSRKRKPSV